MRFTSQHKAINQKEYGKAVSPLRYDSLALILSWSIFVVYGKQSEKNKYICNSKRHSALHTFWDTTFVLRYTQVFGTWGGGRALTCAYLTRTPQPGSSPIDTPMSVLRLGASNA